MFAGDLVWYDAGQAGLTKLLLFSAFKKPSPEGEGWVRGNYNKSCAFLWLPYPELSIKAKGLVYYV